MSSNLGTIRIELTEESIDEAISKLRQVKKDLKEALNATVQELGKRGETAAKAHLYAGPQADDEPDYGDVAASIHYKPGSKKGTAYIYSSSEDAAYLEYGTGLVGKTLPHEGLQRGISTPPILKWGTHLYTAYDTYGHGAAGWWFEKDGRRIHTVGIPARQFMYRALRDMEVMAPEEMLNQLALINVRRWGG